MPTRRGRDLKIRYDGDEGGTFNVAQRTYRDDLDQQITPVTASLLARVQDGIPIERTRKTARYAMCCLPNSNNQNGRSMMKVIIPYRPATPEIKTHLLELIDYDEAYKVESVRYFSEGLS